MLVTGASGSGKTFWVARLLRQLPSVVEWPNGGHTEFKRILYCYSMADQPIYDELAAELPQIDWHQGLPEILNEKMNGTVWADNQPTLIIFDDLTFELDQTSILEVLFSRVGHHTNTSVIFITYDIFSKSPSVRAAFKNAHYMVVFGQRRSLSGLSILGSQVYGRLPGASTFLVSAYEQQPDRDPIFLNLHPATNIMFRCLGNFLDNPKVVYLPPKLGDGKAPKNGRNGSCRRHITIQPAE